MPKRKASERIIAYKAFFNSKDGEVVLRDLMRAHHFFEPGFHADATELARMAGERNVICYILSMTGVSEKDLENLMKEERDE